MIFKKSCIYSCEICFLNNTKNVICLKFSCFFFNFNIKINKIVSLMILLLFVNYKT